MKPTIGIIDYGLGNIFSVENALRSLSCDIVTADDPEKLKGLQKIILPGVGSFADGMNGLNSLGFTEFLHDFVSDGGYLLGICLGMQLLMPDGKEGGVSKGLGFVEGEIEPIEPSGSCRVPHIGWNDIYGDDMDSMSLFENIKPGSSYYFVHSYHVLPGQDIRTAYTEHCDRRIVAALQKDNVFGVQFHPEKSQQAGVTLLNNFLQLQG